jgi:hypothetical protein
MSAMGQMWQSRVRRGGLLRAHGGRHLFTGRAAGVVHALGKSLGRPAPLGYRNTKGSGCFMTFSRLALAVVLTGTSLALSGCGGGFASGDSGLFRRKPQVGIPTQTVLDQRAANEAQIAALERASGEDQPQSTIWDLFSNSDDPNTTVEVNKYLWLAAQDVLNFLPIESVDPFTGVIVTGYGAPPGGGRAYRATIYVQDPALDARSLRVALQARGGGAVAPETQRAVEDAILTRARQLRIQDTNL